MLQLQAIADRPALREPDDRRFRAPDSRAGRLREHEPRRDHDRRRERCVDPGRRQELREPGQRRAVPARIGAQRDQRRGEERQAAGQ